jgi:class 3 adenylate cyclase/tetratricopeptide (TPR) repeat protein
MREVAGQHHHPSTLPPVEVRKVVTVLFADVTGSTALGERLDPESLRGLMSRYFEEMRSAVASHGGTVEKFIGDALMAVFGVPTVHEDDALRAVRAAVQMRELLASLNVELERTYAARLEIRTGINTGEVVAGDPAGGQSFVTGDTVNVAARLEQAAEPGEILIGEETHRLVRDAVVAEPIDPLELKGKAERVIAFRLEKVTPGAAPYARRLDSPLVGREDELERLRGALDEAARQGICRAVTVVGDAGLGKTRLVTELVNQIAEQQRDPARALWARCLPYGEGITFWPIAEIVKEAAGIGESDSPDAAHSKVRALVANSEDGPDVADRVAAAIGLNDGGGDLQETFWAVRRLLEILARDSLLVVILEDIHWAEPTFLDLMQYLVRFSTDHPLLLVSTARPDLRELRPDWGSVVETIVLEPLARAECDRLIANLLGQVGLPADVQVRITDAAEGNPLFVEEMLRRLIDERLLERDDGHWTARGDLSRVAVPGTISALLSARLDQLGSEERGVIQRASVVGKVFWWGAVTDLSPERDRPGVGSHLQTLLRKELVSPDRSSFAGEDAFRFSHILVRDAAYDSMPKRIRAELHERFASWLERKAGQRIAEFEEIIGYHLEHAYRYRMELGPADDAARAVAELAASRLAAAGRRALAHWDVSATVNLLSRAVTLLPEGDPSRLELLPDLGMALAQSDIPRADAVLTEAVESARARGDGSVEARAGVRRVFVRLLLDPAASQAASLEEVERYLGLFEGWGDDAGLAEAGSLVGMIRFWQGRAAMSEEDFQRALEHARRAGERRQEGEILRRLALVIYQGPTPADEAIRRLESVLEQGRGDRRVEIGVTRGRAGLEAMEGRIDVARELIERGKALARELGDQVSLAAVLRDSGFVEMLAGDPAAAETELRTGYEILERVGDTGHLSSFAPDLGDAVYAQGLFDEALALAEFTERITIPGDVDAEVRGAQLRARALARRGRLDDAGAQAREAVRLAAGTDYLELHAHALMSLAEVLSLTGRNGDAAAAAREALDRYRRKGNVIGAARAGSRLAELEA